MSQGLSVDAIEKLIGPRDYKPFLNSRNELYREMDMKTKPPSRTEAIRLMSKNPNLIRRPILENEGELIPGFDEGEYERMLKRR